MKFMKAIVFMFEELHTTFHGYPEDVHQIKEHKSAASFSMIAWTISITMSMLRLTMLWQDGDASTLFDTTNNDPNTAVEVRGCLKISEISPHPPFTRCCTPLYPMIASQKHLCASLIFSKKIWPSILIKALNNIHL